jgi:PadR family transcriptional regulator PadR
MRPDVVRGHLDGLIMAILERGQRHGFAIITELQLASGGKLDLPTGTVYPALHRLERAGLIAGSWDETTSRRRRTYRLTAAGRRDLARVRAEWQEFSLTVGALLGGAS